VPILCRFFPPTIDREDGIRRTWQWFTDSVFTV
jgi:hypothetical protein